MIRSRTLAAVVAASACLGSGVPPASAADAAARGAGATFPQPVYTRWAALYAAETGEVVAYDGIGSGAGVKAIEADGVAFGASDTPLDEAELKSRGLVQFPTLVGGVVPVVDVPGVGPGDLVLDGPTLADLCLRSIDFWDDPAIVRLNPHLPLPHLPVRPIRRSDASGTTATFAAYLAGVSRRDQGWFAQHPDDLPPTGTAVQGSKGMADAVAATPGAIGYVGFDYAQANRLTYVDLINPAGRVVQPTLSSIASAAETADWSDRLTPSLVAQPGGASWPIVSATYVLMRRTNADDLAAWTALKFFGWAFRSGGPAAEDFGFVPLPTRAEAAVRHRLLDVRNTKGQALAPPEVTSASPGASR